MPTSDAAVHVDPATWSDAVRVLRAANSVLLVCHVAPDGDALGSMLALARGLRAAGADVTCTWGDDPWTVPTSYSWLPDIDRVVPPAQAPEDVDVLVVLDTASRDRLGVLGSLVDSAPQIVVVDHHAHNSGIDGVQVVDPGAAATAAIVEELLRRLEARLDATTATLLYVGLVTDTGSFQHSVTTPAVHAVAGRLLAAGARPDEIARQLWGSRPVGFLHVLGAALARLRVEADAGAGRGWVWTWTAAADLAAAGVTMDEIEPVIDIVRSAREVDVAAVFKQDADGSFRVSTRSRGRTDVGSICASLGGGGHTLAAGFTSYDDPEATAARIRAALATAPAP